MPYVSSFDRNQLMCCSWDAFVDEESIAKIIDAFVEHLDIKKYGVKAVTVEGRPSYDPFVILGIGVHSARELTLCITGSSHPWSLSLWSDGERLCKYGLQH